MSAMDALSIASSSASSLTESIVTSSVRRKQIEENDRKNKEMLQKFLGVRPVALRRHASMRGRSRSARRDIERRTEEEESMSSSSIAAPDDSEIREDPEDVSYAHNKEDDWSHDAIKSVPSAICVSDEEKAQKPIKSCLIVKSSSSSFKQATAPPKRRLSALTSKLALVACVVGKPKHHYDDGLDLSLHYDSSASEDDDSEASHREEPDKYEMPGLLAVFDSYLNPPAREPNNQTDYQTDHQRQRIRGMECIAPFDDISFDSYSYELSIGSFTDNTSRKTPF